MSTSTPASGSQPDGSRAITLGDILAAKSSAELDKLAKVIGVNFPASMSGLPAKKMHLVEQAHAKCMLHESQCAKVVEENPQMQDQLEAVKLAVHNAQQVAAVAAAEAGAAKAAAAAAQEDVAVLREQVQELLGTVRSMQQQSEEATDAAAQQAIQDQTIWFGHSLEDGELMQSGDELRASVCTALRAAGLPEVAIAGVKDVSVLPARGGDRRAPVVLRCASVPAKVALLQAARRAGTPERGLQMASRLTRWQQARKKALLPQLLQLKSEHVEVRFTRGHVLQKKVGGKWVDVPLAAAA